jgi:molybdopterin/thiamine biosynthesis adenylyltransferase
MIELTEIRKIKFRNGFNPFPNGKDKIRIGNHYPRTFEMEDNPQRDVWKILSYIDSTRSYEEIVRDVVSDYPEIKIDFVKNLLETLWKNGLLENSDEVIPVGITKSDKERFSRNVSYFSFIDTIPGRTGYDIQLLIKKARVTVVGMGGVGSSVAASLIAMGVGNLHIVDFDKVELSNLTRQILFSEEDIGMSKVLIAARKLGKINAGANITYEETHITSSQSFDKWMQNSDVLILSADTPTDIYSWCNESAMRWRRTWFHGGYDGPRIVCEGFVPYKTGCWECKQKLINKLNDRDFLFKELDSTNSVIAPTAIISAQFLALETLNYITGIPSNTLGKLYVQNALSYDDTMITDVPIDSNCVLCNT